MINVDMSVKNIYVKKIVWNPATYVAVKMDNI